MIAFLDEVNTALFFVLASIWLAREVGMAEEKASKGGSWLGAAVFFAIGALSLPSTLAMFWFIIAAVFVVNALSRR